MILVTGGTGLVGSRLLYDLAKEGKNVLALKRPSSSLKIFENWFQDEPELIKFVEWIEGDLLDIFSLEQALVDVSVVYHCAAAIFFDPKKAKLMEQINIEGTANLVNICLDKKEEVYFCHVSSVASLGRITKDTFIDEHCEWIPGSHNSNYGISKYGAEREVWRGISEGLKAIIVNPSIILGPGDWNKGSSELFKRIKNGFLFYTDGESGFVDVRDVTKAMLFLVKKNIVAERFILNAENISFRKLFIEIAAELKVKAPTIFVKPWISAIVWRLEKIRSFINGKTPFITKETAHSGHQIYRYNAQKIANLGFTFKPLNETIKFTCDVMKKNKV